ncbi:MAG TPA: hypothetical protein VK772_18460, partial [Puia sp.]|nr:hypothetical protein [Puia sp.]
DLFDEKDHGAIAGEGSFMTWINNIKESASAELLAVKTIHTEDPNVLLASLNKFLSENIGSGQWPDLLLTGENGDIRLQHYYNTVESSMDETVSVARFKHLSGEYCTATSFACWLAIQIFETGEIPALLMKKPGTSKACRRILIYNNYRGVQHAFILVSAV